MPQARDPKTGRYTSGGGSSVGGAAGTNSRIQKAKAVGGGASAGNPPPIKNPLPQLTKEESVVVDSLIRDKGNILNSAPVKDVPLNNIKSMQDTLRADSIQHFAKGGTAKNHPIILQTANRSNVVLDGNHRVLQAILDGKTTIKARHVKIEDLYDK